MKKLIYILLFSLSTCVVAAQGSISKEALNMSLFQFEGGVHFPGGDIAERFGTNAAVGFSYAYKLKSNFLFGAEFSFLFGDNVNNRTHIAHNLRTASGQIIGFENRYVDFLILERGFATGFYAGKIFPVFGPNPNSGVIVRAGVEYLQYKTYIETRNDKFPPFEDEYLKGYDRLVGGLALHEFIGYQHFSNNHLVNFFVGFDLYQGFTTDYRSYSIDLMQETNNDYFDTLWGFRVGWVLPVYKRAPEKFYIN